MGTPKGLLPYQGRSWLQWQLEQLSHRGLDSVVLILGPDFSQYLKVLPELGAAQNQWCNWRGDLTLRLVINPEVERGPFSSLQCGLKSWATTPPACFVLPLDTPCGDASTWQLLKDYMNKSDYDVTIPTLHDKGGHPVLLSAHFLRHLSGVDPLAPEARLDLQIRQLAPEKIARLPVTDKKVLINLNTPEQWQAFAGSGELRES
ncbi:MAG: NTP transferase domain-containing protein [Bdellovibrionales bacterium]|nr:NTP transferase domain-containing protein [Bdellovibrionales bacterium]